MSDYIGKETPHEYVIDAANGLVSSKDPDTIFLSANSERPILGVAKHELVHLFSNTKAGQALNRSNALLCLQGAELATDCKQAQEASALQGFSGRL